MELTLSRLFAVVPMGLLVVAAALLSACDNGSGGILDAARGEGTLQGTITIAAGSRVDRDTAVDIEVLERATVDNPQNPDNPLPGNVILGGYVSASSGTFNNQLRFPADGEDRYRIELAEGQRVTVNIFPSPFQGDTGLGEPETRVTLTPVDADAETVSVGADTERSKSVVADAEGLYELSVEATGGGPARYVLRATALSQDETLTWQGNDFVPGEAIITYSDEHRAGRIQAQSVAPVAAGRSRDLGARRQHVKMPEPSQSDIMGAANAGAGPSHGETLRWIRELEAQPGIASAVPNHRIRTVSEQGSDAPRSQEQYSKQRWHYELINMVPAWDAVPDGGQGVRVAVLDTGILEWEGEWHPELAPNIDCTSPDGCRNEVENNANPQDTASDYHGTHVAGILAADATDSDQITGVAHGAHLIPVKVLGGSEGTVSDVIAGVEWVTNGGEPRADIINLSLGSPNDNRALQEALQQARNAGILVVGASGNTNDSRRFFPAAYPSVFAVGAVDCTGARAPFSNFGDWLDLMAPGGGNPDECADDEEHRVFSAFGSRSTGEPTVAGLTGTSMAAPHVAGVYALMLRKHPGLSPPVVRALVREGLITQGNTDGSISLEMGRGLIDAEAATSLDDPESLVALAPQPQKLVFSDTVQELTLKFRRVGEEEGSISDVSLRLPDGVDWLTEPQEVDARHYELSLRRDNMAVGRFYRTVVEVEYQGNGRTGRYEIPVSASLDAGVSERNAGAHFVQLIPAGELDSGSLTPARQQLVEAEDGRYEFSFDTSGLTPGDYFLVAGTDLDNDGVICSPGEACAEFPVTGQPQPISITRNMRKEVEMETAFTRPVGAQPAGGPGAGGYLRLDR